MKTPILLLLVILSISCRSKTVTDLSASPEHSDSKENALIRSGSLQGYETAYFASGCFWCVEAIYERVKGVKEVYSGYSGGSTKNPTYEEVAYGKTDHAEAIEVHYDPNTISFTQLVEVFFGSHDPTTLNRQGPDRGTQYRSIAFYKNDMQKQIILDHIARLESEKVYDRPIVTEVKAFEKFYMAEDYHQDFEKNNPDNPFIQNVSIPRLNSLKDDIKSYLKEDSH